MPWPTDLPDGLRPCDLADPDPAECGDETDLPADFWDAPSEPPAVEPDPEPDAEFPW